MSENALTKVRKAWRPVFDAEKKHRALRHGETDVPCVNCGLLFWNEFGRNGKVYCSICLGRGRDEWRTM